MEEGDATKRPKRRCRNPAVQNPSLHEYTPEDLRHWRSLPHGRKKRVAHAEALLRDADDGSLVPYRFRVLEAGFQDHQKLRLLGMIRHMRAARPGEESNAKMREYIDFVCQIPTAAVADGGTAVAVADGATRERLTRVSACLDRAVYGQAATKRALLRVVANWMTRPGAKGMCIGLQGPYGVGKTSLVTRGLAQALDLPFSIFALGGMTDASALVGHDYTYSGAQPGSIARALVRGRSVNQVLLFDELDKVSGSDKGEEIVHALVHMTDDSQNDRVRDKYVGDIDIDLSRCLMVFTFNDAGGVPPVLLDRMSVVAVPGYGKKEKAAIAGGYLVPEALRAFGLEGSPHADALRSEEFVQLAVASTGDQEKGVRMLQRSIRAVCAEINLAQAMGEECRAPAELLREELKKGEAPRPFLSMYS